MIPTSRIHHLHYGIIAAMLTAIISICSAGAQSLPLPALLSPAMTKAAPALTEKARKAMPIHVSALDILSKAYGIAECRLDSASCVRKVIDATGITPSHDEYGHWLESVDGYRLDYAGMSPEVSAMARYDDGAVEDFAFFFIFPYGEGERDWANERQARFSGSLLQELADMGLSLGADASVSLPEYFTVATSHEDRPVDILLREDTGQFVLAVHILNE